MIHPILAGIDAGRLLQVINVAIEMKKNRDLDIFCAVLSGRERV